MSRGRIALLSVIVVSITLLAPIRAGAATIPITVVSSAGVPQPDTFISDSSNGFSTTTDGYGQASLDVSAGDTLFVSRSPLASTAACAAPEGAKGASFQVSNPPAALSITLPAFSLMPVDPALSDRERGLVGLVNDLRRRHGLQPLQISTVLNSTADGYVPLFSAWSASSGIDATCLAASPVPRFINAGYPLALGPIDPVAGEDLMTATSASDAFLSAEQTQLLTPNFDSVGVGNSGNTWVLDFAQTEPGFGSQAGITGDYGDAALADVSNHSGYPGGSGSGPAKGSAGAPLPSARRSPRLHLQLKQKGSLIRYSLSATEAALKEGTISLTAIATGHPDRKLQLSTDLQGHASLPPGAWLLVARYKPSTSSIYRAAKTTRVVIVHRRH